MVGSEGQRLHKSHVKVTAAHHEAAIKKGAVEVRPGTVLHKEWQALHAAGQGQLSAEYFSSRTRRAWSRRADVGSVGTGIL